MKNRLLFFSLLLHTLLLGSSLTSQEPPSSNAEKPADALEEIKELDEPAPLRSQADFENSLEALIHGNSTFAFKLYDQVRSQQGNIFFSPYSISSALAVPYMGAKASTQNQMQRTLHFLPQVENLERAFAELNRRFGKSWMQGSNEIRLLIANALFIQRNLKLEVNFLERVKRSFGSLIKQVDFERNPEGARININDWVREATHGRIPTIVESRDITPDTRLAVISSILLKAVWEYPFDPSLTTQAPFFIDSGTTISVPMMNMTKRLRVLNHPQFTLLELPYSANAIAPAQFDMLLLLPHTMEGIAQTEELMDPYELQDWIRKMETEQVIVSLPRFSFAPDLDLAPLLKKMGMPVAFSEVADFTGMYAAGGLYLNKVLHKAYVSVDEKGTEAVAATAATINTRAVLNEKPAILFKADHPFIFIILERTTRSILFIGRFSIPTKNS